MFPFLAKMLAINHQVFGVIAEVGEKSFHFAVKLWCAHWSCAENVEDRVRKQSVC